jgi:hypothetical protein
MGSAVYLGGLVNTIRIGDNLFTDVENANRSNYLNGASSGMTIYMYGNRLYAPIGSNGIPVSDTLYHLSADTAVSSPAHIYVYHNTFVGYSAILPTTPRNYAPFPNVLMVNNLMQGNNTNQYVLDQFFTDACNYSNGFAGFDYNLTYGQAWDCPWTGTHNVSANMTGKMFTDTSLPSTWTPSGSALNAGIDISKAFVVNGVSYSALPGFSSGYAGTDGKPDIGAAQSGTVSPTPTPTPPPPPPAGGCTNLWNSSLAVPANFGASFNWFSTAKELLINVLCSGSSSATVNIGNGSALEYIYKTGYTWTNNQWTPFNYSGQTMDAGGNWFIGSASNAFAGIDITQKQSVLAYICEWDGSAWHCGCHDQTCATNYWNLQQFKQ